MSGSDIVDEHDIARLAALQLELLPSSMVSRLGGAYARAFFRFVSRSPDERLTVERDAGGRVIAGCVFSRSLSTLSRRLLMRTPLPFAVLMRPWVLKFVVGNESSGPPDDVELVLLFTDSRSQGSGAASRLVQRCDRAARAMGIGSYVVRTLSDPENPAYRFYIARGFEPEGEFQSWGQRFAILRRNLISG